MAMAYPTSWWSYGVNAVWYWPYRDNEVTSSRDYQLPLGEHRYFRYNIRTPNIRDVVLVAGAAGVWVRNVSCYAAGKVSGDEVTFCEGFLEPKYAGITLGSLQDKIFSYAMEVSLHPSDFVDEALQDLDDYLTMDYHTVRPVHFAAQTDILHPNSYYSATLIYRGKRAGTWKKAPPPATVATELRNRGMGFYQPYEAIEPNAVTFILQTGEKATTPQQLAIALKADAAIVNLQTLDPTSQDFLALGGRYSGETPTELVVQFFKGVKEAVPEGASKLAEILKYTAIVAGVLGAAWLGLKAYPFMQEAYEGATRKKVKRGA